MKKLTAQQVREIWLKFFESKKHSIIESSPLVPVNDPTLLWINAGVAPLKKYFDGSQIPPNKRMTNIQKCIRTNDIENVGLTSRHHTFFEMLGNFSIGDYFKKEAIEWGLEILTSPKYFGFDLNNLYFTYYPTDFEAKSHWLRLGVPESRIIASEENFWEIGEGPCGPCTEVYFDRGEKFDHRGIELIRDDIENDRYIEIWNIVFSQYNSKPGLKREEYPELPNKNIDTGAGLERIVSIFQDTKTNFETDLFMPIIKHVESLSRVPYSGQKEYKIIADHSKTITMALSDGAVFSNEGRGYVLRRLLRRALKHSRTLGLNEPFMHLLVDDVVKIMEIQYPSVKDNVLIVKKIILIEEEKFLQTLTEGERQFNLLLAKADKVISGKDAFKLFDTYGFPIELTAEYASEHNLKVDFDGFNEELELQKERSRSSRLVEGSMHTQDERFLRFELESKFVGYTELKTNSKVIAVFDQGIVLDKTPFYAESGGQVSDKGSINGLEVLDVIKLPNGQHLHIIEPAFEVGEMVVANIDQDNRNDIIKNHSATHLLHKALKDVLGKHVNQHGSRVSSESLRFDFNNFTFPTTSELLKMEKLVNEEIKESHKVNVTQMNLDDAKARGAQALFTEKYDHVVRVVDMGDSIELCGGTHVNNTSDIKGFAIASIESIGSGVYRIEAVTGDKLDSKVSLYLKTLLNEINNLDDKLSKLEIKEVKYNKLEVPKILGSYQDIINYRKYLDDYKLLIRDYEKEVNEYHEQQALKDLSKITNHIKSKHEVLLLQDYDESLLKGIVDQIFDEHKLETLFLCNVRDGKITFIAKSSLGNANTLIKTASEMTDGRGGGRPDFARGGGTNLSKLDAALNQIKVMINE